MVLFNYSTKELTAKIVYYGPGLCGKTTNLQYVHQNLPGEVRGKMLSLATKTDRTLFFDFLPIDLGDIRGMKTRVQLYTVPGQVFYNETRKLVLKGADGIVFVADSQEQMLGANVESFRNLEENLKAHGMTLSEIPHVLQFNKRDLPRLSSIEELNSSLNKYNAPFYESVATTGIGVQDTLKAVVKLVLLHLTGKYEPQVKSTTPKPVAQPAEPVAAAPVATVSPAPPEVPQATEAPVATPASRSIPVSDFQTPDTSVASVPLSEMSAATDASTPSADLPPPPDFRGTAAPGASDSEEPVAPAFADEEIDELVEEVEEAEEPVAALIDEAESLPEAEPLAAAPETQDDGLSLDDIPFDEVSEPEVGTEVPAIEEGPGGDDSVLTADAGMGEIPLSPIEEPVDSVEDPPIEISAQPISSTEEPAEDLAGLTVEMPFPTQAPESPPVSSWAGEEAPAETKFEVDRGFDPDWQSRRTEAPRLAGPAPVEEAPPLEAAEPIVDEIPVETEPPVQYEVESVEVADAIAEEPAAPEPPEEAKAEPLLLTEVAEDADLFTDPDIVPARIEHGTGNQIIVPVELGRGADVRRFKLTIRLDLDPVE
jgi:signal recognition particle receptor subunit beta